MKNKPSEIFEGENSSLRKTFDNAINSPQVEEVTIESILRKYNVWSQDLETELLRNKVEWIKRDSQVEESWEKEIDNIMEEIIDNVSGTSDCVLYDAGQIMTIIKQAILKDRQKQREMRKEPRTDFLGNEIKEKGL